jgi:hypothetical protein
VATKYPPSRSPMRSLLTPIRSIKFSLRKSLSRSCDGQKELILVKLLLSRSPFQARTRGLWIARWSVGKIDEGDHKSSMQAPKQDPLTCLLEFLEGAQQTHFHQIILTWVGVFYCLWKHSCRPQFGGHFFSLAASSDWTGE